MLALSPEGRSTSTREPLPLRTASTPTLSGVSAFSFPSTFDLKLTTDNRERRGAATKISPANVTGLFALERPWGRFARIGSG